MITNRWRSTRARLCQDGSESSDTGLWNRIAESRRAGATVQLPTGDPRRPVSPILLGVLLVALIAGTGSVWKSGPPAASDTMTSAGADREALNALEWLTTPAHAQSSRISTLPPIDPPDMSRMTPRTLLYRFSGGADGETTEQYGIDTMRIARDSVTGSPRIVVTYNSMPRRARTPINLSYSGVDTLALSTAGRFLFLKSSYSRNDRPQLELQRNLLVSRDSITFVGYSPRLGKTVSRTFAADFYFFFEEPFVALLPALPLREGYARSLSVLDLLGGETSPGFRRLYELRVTGQQEVTVPAGSFRCWTVELSSGEPTPFELSSGATVAKPTRLYIDIESGTLVRAIWNASGGFFREQVLIAQ